MNNVEVSNQLERVRSLLRQNRPCSEKRAQVVGISKLRCRLFEISGHAHSPILKFPLVLRENPRTDPAKSTDLEVRGGPVEFTFMKGPSRNEKILLAQHEREFTVVRGTHSGSRWRCSSCKWAAPNPRPSGSDGFERLLETMNDFVRHRCKDYTKSDRPRRLQPNPGTTRRK